MSGEVILRPKPGQVLPDQGRRAAAHGRPVKAVDGVSFDLLQGETLGIVGESGLRQVHPRPAADAAGEADVGQADLRRRRHLPQKGAALRKLRRDIQIVFQDPYTSLNPRMTVGDIVGEPFEIHPDALPKGGRRRRVQELLDLVGLNPEHINRYPHQFSGGQRQRIGIARGLALSPEVIVSDEPVSALDVSVQAQVVNLLDRLQTSSGCRTSSSPTTCRWSGTSPTGSASCTSARWWRLGRRGPDLLPAHPPVHPSPAVGRAGARPDAAQLASDRAHRRRAEPGQPAVGMPVPYPMLEGPGDLQRRRTETHRPARRALCARVGLPLRGAPGRRLTLVSALAAGSDRPAPKGRG